MVVPYDSYRGLQATLTVGRRGAGWRFGCGAVFARRLVKGRFGVRRGRFASSVQVSRPRPTGA